MPTMREIRVWYLGWEDSQEKAMATYSSILAWKILWTKEPSRLQSMGLQRVDTTEWLHFHFQTTVEVMKIIMTSLKWSHACTATLSAPNPVAGPHQPTLSLETHRQAQNSLLCGPFSTDPFSCVLVCKVLLCTPKVHFPVLCTFW